MNIVQPDHGKNGPRSSELVLATNLDGSTVEDECGYRTVCVAAIVTEPEATGWDANFETTTSRIARNGSLLGELA